MMPHTTLFDENIDRPKLSEQKNPFEYIVSPPSRVVGTVKRLEFYLSILINVLNNRKKWLLDIVTA